MINLNHLKYFFYCAQYGSISAAAEKLGVAQPSMSIQLRALEGEIGFPLFIRTGRGIRLTPRGQALFKKTTQLFGVVNDIEKFVFNEEVLDSVNFRVGVTDEIERPFLSDVTGQLIKSQSTKKMSASIISKSHNEIVEMAFNDELDIVISDRKISGLNLINEYKIPVMLISSKNCRGTNIPQMSSANQLIQSLEQDLALPTEDLLLGSETSTFLRKVDLKPHVAINSNILACIARSVQENMGVAFLPILYVNKEIKNGKLFAYGPPTGFWKHRIFLYSKSKKKEAMIVLFSSIIRNLTTAI